MHTTGVRQSLFTPTATAIAGLVLHEYLGDLPRVSIPQAQFQLIFRFGPTARNGLDGHVLGVRDSVHRKLIRDGQSAIGVRLHLGAHAAVLGVPASELAGRIVALEDVWGERAARRLLDALAAAPSKPAAVAILDATVAARTTKGTARRSASELSIAAAARLARTPVHTVASDLGVSERHLRRVFRDTIGIGPKTFAKLTRFKEALRVARNTRLPNWAGIAANAGYYDQAHLIADFRAIAGVTPRALLVELRGSEP